MIQSNQNAIVQSWSMVYTSSFIELTEGISGPRDFEPRTVESHDDLLRHFLQCLPPCRVLSCACHVHEVHWSLQRFAQAIGWVLANQCDALLSLAVFVRPGRVLVTYGDSDPAGEDFMLIISDPFYSLLDLSLCRFFYLGCHLGCHTAKKLEIFNQHWHQYTSI